MDTQDQQRQHLVRPLRADWASLSAAAVALLCIGGFIIIARLTEAEPTELDRRLLLAMRHEHQPGELIGPGWIKHLVVMISALGTFVVLTLVTVAAFVRLIIARQSLAAWWVLLAATTGLALEQSLKWLVGRPRPMVVPHLEIISSPSMPSGHAMMSGIVYLTIALLISRLVRRGSDRAAVIVAGVAFMLLIGSTRVLLGVHNPTDVLAGWMIGAGWALLCWLSARAVMAIRIRWQDCQTVDANT